MSDIDVSPTRMELLNVRAKLSLARRGYDMLKKKRDTLIAEEIAAREDFEKLKSEVYCLLSACYRSAKIAEMEMGSSSYLSNSFNRSKRVVIETVQKKVVGVSVPFSEGTVGDEGGIPYSFFGTPESLDVAAKKFRDICPLVVRLASLDKKVHVLNDEIKRTRRKVNALDKVKIRSLAGKEKYIRDYLDEMEREDYTRLKHIKEIVKEGCMDVLS